MSKLYLYVGDHAATLASGRPIEPGEEVAASDVDTVDANDKHLIDDGLLIQPAEEKRAAKETDL